MSLASYRTKHFALQELVSPEVYKARQDLAWDLLRPGALVALDALRDRYGRIVVNNWNAGGPLKESGLRGWECETGARWSMHRFGGAFDLKFGSVTPQEVFRDILAHPEQFPQITTLEDVAVTPTWLHFDVRNHARGGIWVVRP